MNNLRRFFCEENITRLCRAIKVFQRAVFFANNRTKSPQIISLLSVHFHSDHVFVHNTTASLQVVVDNVYYTVAQPRRDAGSRFAHRIHRIAWSYPEMTPVRTRERRNLSAIDACAREEDSRSLVGEC